MEKLLTLAKHRQFPVADKRQSFIRKIRCIKSLTKGLIGLFIKAGSLKSIVKIGDFLMQKNTQLFTVARCIACVLLTTIAVLCVSPAIAGAQLPEESTWVWGRMTSLVEKWDFESGKAHVSVKGSAFNAELFVGDNTKLVRFRLNGTIKGDTITVRAVTLESDVGPDILIGKIITNTYKGFADIKGDQQILLRDDIGNQIGLTRALLQ